MDAQRAYYECDNCHMKIHLVPPVERPCPACGGNFIETEEEEEFSDLDLGTHRQLSVSKIKMTDKLIDKIVEDEFPAIIEGFEDLLANDARTKGWG